MENTEERAQQLRSYVNDLNTRVLAGDVLGAFDDYYHENVSMQENQNDPVIGKAVNRVREEEWLANVTEFRNVEVRSVGVDADNDVVLVEWVMEYGHKQWGDVNNHQVTIQKWSGNQIVHERFVYG